MQSSNIGRLRFKQVFNILQDPVCDWYLEYDGATMEVEDIGVGITLRIRSALLLDLGKPWVLFYAQACAKPMWQVGALVV